MSIIHQFIPNDLQTTFFYNLPYDIIFLIWNINIINAASYIQLFYKKFNPLRKIRIKLYIKDIHKMIKFAFFNAGFDPGINTYHIYYNGHILNNFDVLKLCNSCTCCSRHQINRPSNLRFWTDTPLLFTHNTHNTHNTHTCNCPCRHISRWICRYCD